METTALVARLRRSGTDLDDVEAKAAAGGLPRSVVDTLSAFANAGGGTLLLGLDEAHGFKPATGFDAAKIRDALAGACADAMEPPLRMPVAIEDIEDALVVRADIPELDPIDKPCFVKARGAYQGSFIRGGDGDRHLSHYEVSQLLANRTQPTYDAEPVADASYTDLDPELVARLIARIKSRSPRAFAHLDEEAVLVRLRVLVPANGTLRPTLGGLLCLGSYPQQFFPQLFISFVAVPGTRLGQAGPDGVRFLDNQTIDGPIPVMLADAAAALQRNMSKAAVVRGLGREDRYDYPLEVVRELLVNALMHRDYSPGARGAQIQVELFADRLVVKSPGGLYGAVSVDQLGTADQVSSSRNAVLAKLLSDLPVSGSSGEVICENRGSGLPSVVAALRQAGMSPPEFDVAPGHVHVTVPQHALLSVETIEWIGTLGQVGLTDHQNLALAMMRGSGRVTNGMLQAWGVDQLSASQALRDLVTRGVAVISGGKRYASYRLAVPAGATTVQPAPHPRRAGIEAELDAIVQAIRAGHTTARSIGAQLGIGYQTVLRRLTVLRDRGVVAPTQPQHSRYQSYVIVSGEEMQ